MKKELELARLEALVTETKEKIENCLEVGEWYWVDRGCKSDKRALVVFKGHDINTYGFNHGNEFTESYGCYDTFCNKSYTYTKATREEVEQALIKESEKRGFKVGVKYHPVSQIGDLEGKNNITEHTPRFVGDFDMYMGFQYIFSGGKWATIITEPEYKDGDIVVATIGKTEYIISFKGYVKFVNRTVNSYHYMANGINYIMKGGHFESIKRHATEEEKKLFLSLLNPQPKVGDIVKVWDADEDVFLIGKLKSIDSESQYPYVIAESTGSPYYFKHAKTLTKQQEVIELLF